MTTVLITRSAGEEIEDLLDHASFAGLAIPVNKTAILKNIDEIGPFQPVKLYVQLMVGPSTASRFSNINRTSVLFVSVSFIILMIISLAWLIFYYVQRFRYIHAKDILAVSKVVNATSRINSNLYFWSRLTAPSM